MSWSRDEVTLLIEEFMKWPNLYKVTSINYKNRNLRRTALESIQKEMQLLKPQITIQDITSKFQALKQNAAKELKKHKNSIKSGCSGGEVYVPSLWYYDIISYVFDHCEPRASDDSLSQEIPVELSQEDSIESSPRSQSRDAYTPEEPEEPLSGVVRDDGMIEIEYQDETPTCASTGSVKKIRMDAASTSGTALDAPSTSRTHSSKGQEEVKR